MPPTRRRSGSPNPQDLAGLREEPPAAGRLRKAPEADPVLGVASGTAREEAPAAAPGAPRRSSAAASAGKAKVGFYQDLDDTARARAAFNWTRAQEGHRSFSDFVASALMREVERLENAYNGGDPWPPMEAGELPTGKPLGA